MNGAVKAIIKTTLLFMLICVVLSVIPFLPWIIFDYWWLSLILLFPSLLFISIYFYGYTVFCYNIANENPAGISNLFAGFSKNIGHLILLNIKKFFLSILWFLLFIIPFFVKSIGYSMATLIFIDNDEVKKSDVIKESKHLMKKNYGRYFAFVLSFFGWFLLAGITGGIALVWVLPKFLVNKAVFYENLKTDF